MAPAAHSFARRATVTMRPRILLFLALLALSAACGGAEDTASAATPPAAAAGSASAAPAPAPPALVDSAIPNDEAQRRFREGLPVATRFSGGEASREALVRRLMRAVDARDTAEVREMVIRRPEFAYLVYPTSEDARPPHQLSPQLSWFLILQNSQKGVTRLFDRLGATGVEYVSHRCESQPKVEGENRLWQQCVVTFRMDGATKTMRLFGSVVERGGHHKFVSYSNDF
jgi:hypothetical protein